MLAYIVKGHLFLQSTQYWMLSGEGAKLEWISHRFKHVNSFLPDRRPPCLMSMINAPRQCWEMLFIVITDAAVYASAFVSKWRHMESKWSYGCALLSHLWCRYQIISLSIILKLTLLDWIYVIFATLAKTITEFVGRPNRSPEHSSHSHWSSKQMVLP